VGKTTLAKLVYDESGGNYRCKVFVSVSQQPDLTRLLSGILIQLGVEENSRSSEINVLIDRIKEHLRSHRYAYLLLVVICALEM
jgi:disease resistance protein RPM1